MQRSYACTFAQGAECGEGLQRRNLSCAVHWGDWPESPPQFVSADLCGEKLVRSIQQEMERPCFVPCPGQATIKIQFFHKIAFVNVLAFGVHGY